MMVSDPVGASLMSKKRYLAELQELKDLFAFCLPVGEHKDKADEYFNSLEQVICTNDFKSNPNPLEREHFDHDEPDVQYTYLSDAVFKERSSRPELRAHGQSLDDPSDLHEGEVPQCNRAISYDYTPLPQCEAVRDFEYGEQDCDNSSW